MSEEVFIIARYGMEEDRYCMYQDPEGRCLEGWKTLEHCGIVDDNHKPIFEADDDSIRIMVKYVEAGPSPYLHSFTESFCVLVVIALHHF